MEYNNIHGYSVSKLTLGTVAFGLKYGISNSAESPDDTESSRILKAAIEAEINSLDTARGYGKAEALIGSFLPSVPNRENIILTSKFRISPENLQNEKQLYNEVFESVHKSLEALGLSKLPFCIFHMTGQLPAESIVKVLPPLLKALKKEALIDRSGISVYHPAEVELFADLDEIQVIQTPMNIFDQRLMQKKILKRLAEKQIALFVRSIFLQGLFFISPESLQPNLQEAAPYLRQLRLLADEAEMGVAQLAFAYIRDIPEITSIVFGAVSLEQLQQNIDFLNTQPISKDLREKIEKTFEQVPEKIITPGSW